MENYNLFTVTQAKKTVKERDAWWTVLVVDPIIVRLLPVVARTSITPNQVTGLSFLSGVIAFIFFLQGSYSDLVIGALFSELRFVLDCLDGKLARLKNQSTKLGAFFDLANDKITGPLGVFGLVLGQYLVSGQVFIVGLGFIFVSLYLYLEMNVFWFKELSGKSVEGPEFVKRGLFGKIDKRLEKFRLRLTPSQVEAGVLVFFIGPILNQVTLGLLFGVLVLSLNTLRITFALLRTVRLT